MRKSNLIESFTPSGSSVGTRKEAEGQPPKAGSGLKNVILIRCDPPRLYEAATGEPVAPFNAYSRIIHRMPRSKRSENANYQYIGHNAFLVDYLYEAKALGAGEIDPKALSETLQSYFKLLTEAAGSDDYLIRVIATRLGRSPITIASANKYKAAANDFLRKYSALLRDSLSKVNLLNPEEKVELPAELIELEPRARNRSEISKMRSNLMEFKPKPDEMFRQAIGGLQGGKAPTDTKRKDFPSDQILDLLKSLPPLERTVALLQCGGSLRQSEAWAMKISDIKVSERTLLVADPNNRRDPSAKELPYKGRATAHIYMFEPFKKMFFESLAEYKIERPTSDSDFLFVSDSPNSYGAPLLEALEANSLNRRLNRALLKAQTENKMAFTERGGKPYTSHSLRHFYGYWARNFVYIPGRPSIGLTLAEIQVLMGHANITATMIYAKLDQEIMMAEIDASEKIKLIWNKTKSIDSLRADSYEALARDLRRRLAA
ncbi:Phage integrase family protein [Pseudomonas syringae pv. cilantro]|nr:site-specific integrase [Pseudomonas syringae group genomosp. 3]KPC32743.1 Phage integrase family protein [Pseudomonas syringae pv. cilantro]QQN28607.1 site-specific integrase [Pseudomonas syringae pv. maculicola]